jgi:hypothetical protein
MLQYSQVLGILDTSGFPKPSNTSVVVGNTELLGGTHRHAESWLRAAGGVVMARYLHKKVGQTSLYPVVCEIIASVL